MKVKLLKKLTIGKKGEVVEVSDEMGRFLIRYNNAVPAENPDKPDKPKKVKQKSEKEHKEDWANYREAKKETNKKRRKK